MSAANIRLERIYLDHNATTPMDPQVIEVLKESLKHFWGNPSSVHTWGQHAKAALQEAQRRIACELNVTPQQLVFTSGATEALNMTIRGVCSRYTNGHIISSTVEHAAVMATLAEMERIGFTVTYVPVGEYGAADPAAVRAALRSDTRLLIFMAANNETGVKSDLEALASIAEEAGVPLIVDGVAMLGKENLPQLKGAIIWCFSGHKIHGPLGIGLAALAPGIRLQPLITGGTQQYGRRGGTENVPAILGFAAALDCVKAALPAATQQIRELRDYFEQSLLSRLEGVLINGSGPRVANTSNLAFEGVDGESLLYLLNEKGVAASMGSACSSGALEPSHVLIQMGYQRSRVLSSLRFSLSRMTTRAEIERAVVAIAACVVKLRNR
jgi:cysteine desulfurase